MSFLKNFHYQIFQVGDGASGNDHPKLIFLHGLMGYARNWKGVFRRLQGPWTVLVYDQRGHGDSFKPSSGYRPEDYADDLKQILDELGWGKISLVGHSMGGRSAFHFAYKYPERVERLVIEDVGPDSCQDNVKRVEQLMRIVPTPFKNKDDARYFFQKKFLTLTGAGLGMKELGQYLYSNIVKVDARGETVDWRFSKNAILESVRRGREVERWNEIEGLVVPTLVLRGELSEELDGDVFARMLSSNSDWLKGYLFSGVGHWIHSEKVEEFTQVVENFLLEG